MKPTILALALVLAACSDPAPPVSAPPEYASTWYSAGGETPAMVFNIHETAFGFGGMLREAGGEAFRPIRQIAVTETSIAFQIPSLNAAIWLTTPPNGVPWVGMSREDPETGDLTHIPAPAPGSWLGTWTQGGENTDLAVMPAAAPEVAETFVKFDDGRWTQFRCQGAGSPAILLDYGAGGSMNSWKDVFEPLSQISQTCMFERAGRGLSDPGAMPRDVNSAVADIDAFIRAAKLTTPVVLVGHSMASYHVRQFANLHRDKTAGLVLVDPSGDGQDARFLEVIPNMKELMPPDGIVDEATVAACSQGLRNLLPSLARSPTPDNLDPIIGKCGGNDPARVEATLSEIASMEVVSTGQIKAAAKPYGDLPLIVLTRGDYRKDMPPGFTPEATAKLKDVWTTMHAEMTAQSSIGQNRTIEGAGHGIQRDKPQAVIDAVTEVIAKARAGMTRQ